jgi:hypothetical protein
MIYYEAANPSSRNWIVYLGGEGGPCQGLECWLRYRYAQEPADRLAMSTLHPNFKTLDSIEGDGIVSGAQNAPFPGWNRIRFNRCSDAASDALETVPVTNGVPYTMARGAALQIPPPKKLPPILTKESTSQVWHRGFNIYKALITFLRRDPNLNRNNLNLNGQSKIVFAGSSDASLWLGFAIDDLAAEVRAVAPGAEVYAVLDAYFEAPLDNQWRDVAASQYLPPPNIYVQYACQSLLEDPSLRPPRQW